MILEQVYDSNMEAIEDNNLELVYGVTGNIVPQYYDSVMEAFLNSTTERRESVIEALWAFYRDWLARGLEGNLSRFFPIIGGLSNAGRYIDFMGNSALSISGGDPLGEWAGLTSDGGGVYYRTGITPSSLITDSDNFTVAITSMTDNDAGVDFGCNDGTNHFSIACKTGGNAEFKAGTVTVQAAVTTGDAIFIMNVVGGVVKGWQLTDRALTELGSTNMAGALPNLEAYLCADNDNSTAANFSQKRIKNLVIYNHALDDSGVRLLGFGLLDMMFKLNTPQGYIT